MSFDELLVLVKRLDYIIILLVNVHTVIYLYVDIEDVYL